MTRVTRDFGDTMQKEAVPPVSSDANFVSNKFPVYKIGADNVIIEPKEAPKVPSLKETVAKETAQLLEQHKRLSVRDLAKRFEKGLVNASNLSDEVKWREVASLDRHVLLKKLRDVLESLKGRVAGRNKDDVEEAISMVEALAVQLTQREGEFLQEKSEVKKLASFLKQATEDAKKVVEEERAIARAEIENARAAVQRVEHALQEQEHKSNESEKQDLEELMKEVQEARRIKMLHQPSKVMDMEHELQALRTHLAEKSLYTMQLRKELAISRRLEEKSNMYDLDGFESLGSCLRIISCSDAAPDISDCSIQWFRVSNDDGKKELIHGTNKTVVESLPLLDKMQFLDCVPLGKGGRGELYGEGWGAHGKGTRGRVVVVQMNGHDNPSSSIHVFHIGKMRIKLQKGKSTKAKESYSASMQLCGVRGGGNAAAQALFWQAKRGLSFTLAFESERERNAAIMLARRFAFDCNIMLAGPNDRAPLGTQ
ncbi:hypothetical protein Taro_008219 [Colocasia esculenta]|uniref:Stomatal closure-related actin-binding protein 1 n=1 Tax=Colocasia esculenta TaxID=4460 RepID=A0A843U0F7_COLES|nr:hypothetical protein [Colocasia esculenta]